MRKGISPFIAMALLIAIVVASATVVGQWVGPFTEQQTERVEDMAADAQACAEIRFEILDAHYENGEAYITVMNTGFLDLPNITAILTGSGNVVAQAEFGPLDSGTVSSETIAIEDGTPEQVVVLSPLCPMISDESGL